jgi:hypothetical protein
MSPAALDCQMLARQGEAALELRERLSDVPRGRRMVRSHEFFQQLPLPADPLL